MDYILFGAGTGASLAVIGWILREWGPRLRDGKADGDVIYSASELIDRMSWARFCASCGMAMVAAGTLILLATAVVTAWNPGDVLAARIVIGMYLFVSVLMLVWAFLYTRQFGTSGIYRPAPVDPVSDTREAVAVTERESSASSEDVPVTGGSDTPSEDESSDESSPDFAEVAASRGGLGRFASFFKRPRSEDTGLAEDAEDLDEDQPDAESDRSIADRRERPEIDEVDVAADADGHGDDGEERADDGDDETIADPEDGDVEPMNTVEVEEIEEEETVIATEAAVVDTDPAATGEAADPAPMETGQGATDVPAVAAIEKPAPVATPEDAALAELRRRRLERLSGGSS